MSHSAASREVHTIEPVYDEYSRILILGTFPSVKSRESQFFYGHPQNRFWKVLASVFEEPVPDSVSEKKDFLLRHHIALWDVVSSCSITGSSDASITNVEVNDLTPILKTADIQQIFVNGAKAESLYKKYLQKETGMTAVRLPSTSPANAAWQMDRLKEAWSCLKKETDSI